MTGAKKSWPAKTTTARAESTSTATLPLVIPGVPPVVFLDANILIPEYLRTIFLEFGEAGLVQVNWSEDVLSETRRNLIDPHGRFRLDATRVDRMLQLTRSHFPQSLVHDFDRLMPQFTGRTDPKDEHVAAGALKRSKAIYGGEPVVLVTANVSDLPQAAFAGTKVRVARPGRFLTELVRAEPGVPAVVDRMLKRFRKPKTTRVDLLNIMVNSGCSEFADSMAAVWGLQPG